MDAVAIRWECADSCALNARCVPVDYELRARMQGDGRGRVRRCGGAGVGAGVDGGGSSGTAFFDAMLASGLCGKVIPGGWFVRVGQVNRALRRGVLHYAQEVTVRVTVDGGDDVGECVAGDFGRAHKRLMQTWRRRCVRRDAGRRVSGCLVCAMKVLFSRVGAAVQLGVRVERCAAAVQADVFGAINVLQHECVARVARVHWWNGVLDKRGSAGCHALLRAGAVFNALGHGRLTALNLDLALSGQVLLEVARVVGVSTGLRSLRLALTRATSGLGGESGRCFSEAMGALADAVPTTLTDLALFAPPDAMGSSPARAWTRVISRCPNLRKLHLMDCELYFEDGDHLVDAISRATQLERLSLDACDMEMYPVELGARESVLFSRLPVFSRLETLRVQECHLDKQGFVSLAAAAGCGGGLAGLCGLRLLNLDTADAPPLLPVLLARLPCLADYSHRFAWWCDETVGALCEEFSGGGLSSLTRLSLNSTFLSARAFGLLGEMAAGLSAAACGGAAAKLRSLELCKCDCDLDSGAAFRLLDAMESLTTLDQLCLHGNRAVMRDLDDDGVVVVRKLKRLLRWPCVGGSLRACDAIGMPGRCPSCRCACTPPDDAGGAGCGAACSRGLFALDAGGGESLWS